MLTADSLTDTEQDFAASSSCNKDTVAWWGSCDIATSCRSCDIGAWFSSCDSITWLRQSCSDWTCKTETSTQNITYSASQNQCRLYSLPRASNELLHMKWNPDLPAEMLLPYAVVTCEMKLYLNYFKGCDEAKKNLHSSNANFIKQIRSNANLIIR